MGFDAGPSFHSQNRHLRVEYLPYTPGLAYDTTFVFGRTHRLQTADMNSCPPLRLTRFRHNRVESGSALARYKSHCIFRNCPFNESTVRSKSPSRSVLKDLPAVSIMSSLLSLNSMLSLECVPVTQNLELLTQNFFPSPYNAESRR